MIKQGSGCSAYSVSFLSRNASFHIHNVWAELDIYELNLIGRGRDKHSQSTTIFFDVFVAI